MAEELFLGGKVRKQSLPLLDVPTGPDAPALKRLDLPQGVLAQLSPPDEEIRYLAWMEFRQGGIRGNHYHHQKKEWLYLAAGSLELIVEDCDSKEREVVPFGSGDLGVIETGVAHAIRPLSAGHGIEFSPAAFAPNDSFPYPLVD